MTTRENFITDEVLAKGGNANNNMQFAEERKPFIISNSIATEIGDPMAGVMEEILLSPENPHIYDAANESYIDITVPNNYKDMLIDNAYALSDDEKEMSLETAFAAAKDQIENRHVLFNSSGNDSELFSKASSVRINNFSDMMIPHIQEMVNDLLERGDDNAIDNYFARVVNIIVDAVKKKVKSAARNIYAAFTASYNNEITRIVEYYIHNSADPITVFPDLITIDSCPNFWSEIEFHIADSIMQSLTPILYTKSSKQFEEEIDIYYSNIKITINEILIKLYDATEKRVIINFTNYMNNHIAELDMTVAHDLQLLIIDRLPNSILMMEPELYMLFNNVITDIDIYWLSIIEALENHKTDNRASEDRRRNTPMYETNPLW